MKSNILKIVNKREAILIGVTLIVGLLLGGLFFGGHESTTDNHNHEEAEQTENTIYTCSMHPQIRQNEPGLCPICAMDLVPMTTLQEQGDDIDPNEIQMTESAIKLADVQTAIVKRGVPEKSVHLLGKVKADERNIAQLTARFGGRIEKLFINYKGQNVKKGQKLGTIYSPDLITAQKELLEAIKYIRTNPSFYKASRSKLKLWDLTDEQIDAIENKGEPKLYFDILSPISGTVTKRQVAVGDYVKKGTALFEVIDLTKVWVMFDAYESDLPWIKHGDNINFTLQSLPGKIYSEIVSYIDPFIDAATRVAQVRVEISNPNLSLKPEMFANGILVSNIAENSNELLIPKSAILWTGKRAVVYVKIPNRKIPSFLYREIVLGPEAGNFYVVVEGLSEAEEIAVNGVFKIDASAQLAGKASMMNPRGGSVSTGHNHGDIKVENTPKENHSKHEANLEQKEFKVYGNCGMCKKRIEKAATSLDGVSKADWNKDTKMIEVSFDAMQIKVEDIHSAIADVGHDTDKVTAKDNTYNDLPGCCKYDRKSKNK
jgi:Cu(I)/Ag(I) efflux system membrane fusion protein